MSPYRFRTLCMSAALARAGGAVQDDKADRIQPLVIEAHKPGTVDMLKVFRAAKDAWIGTSSPVSLG